MTAYTLSMRVLVFGTFDHLHPGHLFVLGEAAKRGELFVVVAQDATVTAIKGRSPAQPMTERIAAIERAFPTAHVSAGNPGDYLAPVRAVAPDLILLGYDQRMPPGVQEADLPCPIERLPALEPDRYKSSLRGARAKP